MDTYQIEIVEPKAKRLLEDLADMNWIRVRQIDVEGQNGKSGNREAIMAFAGSWDSFSEADFQEYLFEAKRSGGEIFDRDVNL